MAKSAIPPAAESNRLKPHSVGVLGIVFFVVAAAAPLAATLGTAPITFGAIGVGAPGAYLVGAIVLLIWAVGYARMSRFVTSSAGFAAYIERGLGRVPGFGAATLAVLAYNLMLMGIYGAFGFFTQALVAERLGIDLPWPVWTFAAIILVGVLGYLDINLSAKVLGVLMVSEVSLLILFDIVVPVQGGAAGVTLEAFAPANVFAGAFGVAILFAAGSFVGFEATAIYGEEAREPRKTIPKATYVAVAFIGVFYAVTMWAIGLSYKPGEVQDAALADPAGFVLSSNTAFVGQWSTDILAVLVVTSYFATLVAFHNTISRYMYSLGRGGVFPTALSRTHARWQSPHVASIVVTVISLIVVGAFAFAGADPFFVMFAWLTGLGSVGVFSLMAATALSAIIFFRRNPASGNLWTTFGAPLLGGLGVATIVVLALSNWALLTGATDGVGVLLPWILLIAILAGVALAFFRRGSVQSITAGFEDIPASASAALVSGAVPPPAREDESP
jgi:amino acid transporter